MSVMNKGTAKRGEWPLTDRQLQCLEGFWSRKTSKQIGQELGITHHAVEKHLLACRERLQVSSSAEAAKLVFGGTETPAVRPYYQAPEVHPSVSLTHSEGTHHPPIGSEGVTSEVALTNRFSVGMTLLLILAVTLGSILAVAGLIAAAQGVKELGSAILP